MHKALSMAAALLLAGCSSGTVTFASSSGSGASTSGATAASSSASASGTAASSSASGTTASSSSSSSTTGSSAVSSSTGSNASASSSTGSTSASSSASSSGASSGGSGTPFDDAVIDAADLPGTLACGATYSASITVRNTGTTTWDDTHYKLGTVDDSDPLYTQGTRIYLPSGTSVAPGQSHTFSFDLVAPSTPGTYTTDWQMVHELVAWFGGIAQQQVEVQCAAPVDASTLHGKLMMGYQGWFLAPGDGSPVNDWVHWFRNGTPDGANATTDLWPDMSELGPNERFDTSMTLPDGTPAQLYSAYIPATVDRHFAWMQAAGVDGVFLQRFISELGDPRFKAARDQVLQNVRAAAEAHGRVFAVEYDISGADPATVDTLLENDWAYLVDTLHVTESPQYLHNYGKPVLAVWGFGFVDRPGTPAQAASAISWFRSNSNPDYQVNLIGGVPHEWRFLNGDSQSDPAWAQVYRSFDVITPWTVGDYADNAGADSYKQNRLIPDATEAAANGREYMPTIFPGFSWHNLNGGPLNQIPRNGGQFYWRQAYDAVSAGSTMIFNAMFDEVDEGTAMYKLAPSAAQLPAQGTYLPLDADGQQLPSDWYLRLAGAATQMLNGSQPVTAQIPITP